MIRSAVLDSTALDATVVLPRIANDQDAHGAVTNSPSRTARSPAATSHRRPDTKGQDTGTSVARHSAVMAVGSIVSRVTGFLRTAAIGAAIGVLAVGNDYNLANTLPGMVYELLLGGVLSSVVIPLLVRARTRDADRGEAYTQRLLSLAVVFLLVATGVAVACTPLFTRTAHQRQTAAADASLDHHSVVPAPSHDLLLRHGGAVRRGAEHPRPFRDADVRPDPEQPRRHRDDARVPGASGRPTRPMPARLSAPQIAVLGLGTTLGIVIQAVGLWPALRRVGFRWRWRWDFRELHLRELRPGQHLDARLRRGQPGRPVVVILQLAQMAADHGDAPAGAVHLQQRLPDLHDGRTASSRSRSSPR